MNLGEMKTQFRLQMPRGTTQGISDDQLTTLFNQGMREINLMAEIYKKDYTEFTAETGKQIYKFSEISELSDYLGLGRGIFLYKNSSSEYIDIIPKTKEWFNERLTTWRSASNGTPSFFAIEGDQIFFSCPFSSALTLRLEDYILAPTGMDNDNNYPWTNTTTEIKALSGMDQSIITYAKWKVQPTLGRDSEGRYRGGSSFAEFQSEIKKGKSIVNRRNYLYNRGYNGTDFK